MATGLQKKFDWAAVATAGIGAAVGGAISRKLMVKTDAHGTPVEPLNTWNQPEGFGHLAAVSAADAIEQATTRSVIEGTSFGDNLVAELPSAIGNTIGNALASRINDGILDARAEHIARSELVPEAIRGNPRVSEVLREGLGYGFSRADLEGALSKPGFVAFLATMAERDRPVSELGFGDTSSPAAADRSEHVDERHPAVVVERMIQRHELNRQRRAERDLIRRNEETYEHFRKLRGDEARNLTSGEEAALQEAFGDLNVSRAAIVRGAGHSVKAAFSIFMGASAVTLGDTVFANPDYFDADWSDAPDQKALLVHELTHLYQYERYGQVNVERGILAQGLAHGTTEAYNYFNRQNHF